MCEDVRSFLQFMNDELLKVVHGMYEREDKARKEVRDIELLVGDCGGQRSSYGKSIEVYREHVTALKRHMENTSAYLRKEVKGVETKIIEAKAEVLRILGINIDEMDNSCETAKEMVSKEIEEDEEDSANTQREMSTVPAPS